MAGRHSSPSEGRVYFRDVKPYAVVDRLDQLRGPKLAVQRQVTRIAGAGPTRTARARSGRPPDADR